MQAMTSAVFDQVRPSSKFADSNGFCFKGSATAGKLVLSDQVSTEFAIECRTKLVCKWFPALLHENAVFNALLP
jgi:hypothetical protein